IFKTYQTNKPSSSEGFCVPSPQMPMHHLSRNLSLFLWPIQPFEIAINPDLAMMRKSSNAEESRRDRRPVADTQDRLRL
ncbi:hypothetical protein ATU3C_18615, partial [Agrobacterium genomosp. 3 str. RTP8]|uniref:hypothetical protein n=1 Tax=Agrobacterium tomkonis TaxID=1183410 RepID=UPI001CDA26CA|nr:hypothetical protein [Agrobacterium tomkonis RTP8]